MPRAMTPLDGILVADFSRVLAGPVASMLLGDLGAEVIKVERPDGGDDTRAWGPPWRGAEATYYLGLNRNKRSLALDLADPEDVELARRLALRADVLIESFRPGLMARWGLDGETLRAHNPGLVTCSVTAFGTGSDEARALPGYDFLAQAMSGFMSVTGEPDGRPLKTGAAVVDLVCGLLAVIGIQAALAERERSGRGRHVEVSLMDAALLSLLNQGSAWVLGGVVPHRRGNRHPSIAPYETYECADRPLAIAVGNDRLFGAPVRGARAVRADRRRALRDEQRARRQRRRPGAAAGGGAAHALRGRLGHGVARRVRAGRHRQRRRRGVRAGRGAGDGAAGRGRRLPAAGAAAAARRRAPADPPAPAAARRARRRAARVVADTSLVELSTHVVLKSTR